MDVMVHVWMMAKSRPWGFGVAAVSGGRLIPKPFLCHVFQQRGWQRGGQDRAAIAVVASPGSFVQLLQI